MKKILVLALAAVMLSVSCVHEFPVATPADVVLKLTFNTDMPYYKTVYFPEDTKSVSAMSEELGFDPQDFSDHQSYDVRYIIEAYRLLSDGSYGREAAKRWVFTDEDASVMDDYNFKVSIDEGKYLFRAWADFVEPGSEDDLYYETSNWKSGIRLNSSDGYDGATDWRDSYAGNVEIEVIRFGSEIEPVSGVIPMNRPHGKYFFLTNDLDEFVTKVLLTKAKEDDTKAPQFDINDYSFVITYTSFVPNSYNIHTDRANDSAPTATFETSLTQLDETRAVMGFDYVITGTQGNTSVRVGLQLKDKDGSVLAEHSNINIPVNASQYTIVEGRFLMQESSGGVAIDPGFNGPDIVVPVN